LFSRNKEHLPVSYIELLYVNRILEFKQIVGINSWIGVVDGTAIGHGVVVHTVAMSKANNL
jgi:hypothetical protein